MTTSRSGSTTSSHTAPARPTGSSSCCSMWRCAASVVDVDIRHPDSDLSGYRLVVAPALQLIGPSEPRVCESCPARPDRLRPPHRVSGREWESARGWSARAARTTLGWQSSELRRPAPLVRSLSRRVIAVETLGRKLSSDFRRQVLSNTTTAHSRVSLRSFATAIPSPSAPGARRSISRSSRPSCAPSASNRFIRFAKGFTRQQRTIWLNFTESNQLTPGGLPLDPVSWRIEPPRKD